MEPGPSEPPPYTISDGRSPRPLNPSSPPSKSPLPTHRPIEAFGDIPRTPYTSYPHGQMPYGQFPQGQFPQGQMLQGQFPQGQMPQGQMATVHMGGPYNQPHGFGQQPGQSYPTPQFGAPGQPSYYPSYALPPQRPPLQQQQQSVVVIGGATPYYNQPVVVAQSFAGHITLACFVFWCCGGLFGAVAFVLAAIASNQSHQDPTTSRQLGRASIWVSVAGIITTVVISCIVIGVVCSRIKDYSYYY